MKLHDKWNVTNLGLIRLQNLNENDLRKEIAAKNLYGGFPTEYANKQNDKIYGKINNSRAKKATGTANAGKAKKGNGKNNTK